MEITAALHICRRWQSAATWIEAASVWSEYCRATQLLKLLPSDQKDIRKQVNIDRENNRQILIGYTSELISLQNFARETRPQMLPMTPIVLFFDDIYSSDRIAKFTNEFMAIEMAIIDPSLVDNWSKKERIEHRKKLLEGKLKPFTVGDFEFLKHYTQS
jgi:hypothetical protein